MHKVTITCIHVYLMAFKNHADCLLAIHKSKLLSKEENIFCKFEIQISKSLSMPSFFLSLLSPPENIPGRYSCSTEPSSSDRATSFSPGAGEKKTYDSTSRFVKKNVQDIYIKTHYLHIMNI